MNHTEKTQTLKKGCQNGLYIALLFTAMVLTITACDKETELPPETPPTENPDGQGEDDNENPKDSVADPSGQIDPDTLSEYLVLKDAIKITGELPAAVDGQVKVDVKDTIFLVKGYPYGNHLRFKHDPSQHVAGFKIRLGSASYYFEVPEDVLEGEAIPPKESDTTAVLVLDLDIPEEVDYPFTTEITIQPQDESGAPIDEFDRWVTVEDPEDSSSGNGCNDITQAFGAPPVVPRWRWDHTIREYNGAILNVLAPNRRQRINSQGAGCCRDDGTSVTTSDSPSCYEGTTAPRLTWMEWEVDDYSVRYEEYLWVFDNGVLNAQGIWDKKQYDRSSTNFCTGEVGYTYSHEVYGARNDSPVGTHDFVPGATHLNINLQNWEGGFRMPSSADIVYTCHVLLLKWGVDDLFISRYEDYTTALPEFHD